MSRRSEISAGLLAFRRVAGLEVLLAHPGGPYWKRRDDGAWTIPKGVQDNGADLLYTALREFKEETGLIAAGTFIPLPAVTQKSGKTVHAFAFEHDFDLENFVSIDFELEWPPRSGKKRSFPEVDRVEWFDLAHAGKKILAYQLPFCRSCHACSADSRTRLPVSAYWLPLTYPAAPSANPPRPGAAPTVP